jgi:pyruvate dehydrogenase E1 component alpha subunit
MHLMSDRAVMATGVVGGTLPIAVGHALALEGDAVAVTFFGDGAVQTGVFHESLNLAALWSARVLFVCENNGWAEFSGRDEHTRIADVAAYGHFHGLPTAAVDGGEVVSVREAALQLLARVRAGEGPALLECHVMRIRPHYEGDLRRGDRAEGDPLARLEARMLTDGFSPDDLARRRADARAELDDACARALRDPSPDPVTDAELVFASAL